MMNSRDENHDLPAQIISSEIREVLEPFENSQIVLNEAEFGYRYIKKFVQNCPEGARILEIGSGPCVLISQLKIDFPGLDINGVEPIGPGFKNFEGTLLWLKENYEFKLSNSGYEDFQDPGCFDLIFLVNVLEHLPDWQHFLRFVAEKLQPAGKCVILCPNHGFPYESHFSLPIIFNKDLTYRFFKKDITRHEVEHDCTGLWESLNFVKRSEVRAYASKVGVEIKFDNSILRDMVERLKYDHEFAQRQRKLSLCAKWALKLGAIRLFEIPIFNRFQPYMYLEVTKRGTLPAK